MASKIQLIVGLIEVSCTENQLGLIVPLEARARRYVEDAVGPIAIVRCVAASLCLNSVDVFWVDLWAKIAGDIRIRDGDAVNQPAHLVSPTNVKLVVCEVGPGNIVCNECQAISSECAGCLFNLFTIDERGRCY